MDRLISLNQTNSISLSHPCTYQVYLNYSSRVNSHEYASLNLIKAKQLFEPIKLYTFSEPTYLATTTFNSAYWLVLGYFLSIIAFECWVSFWLKGASSNFCYLPTKTSATAFYFAKKKAVINSDIWQPKICYQIHKSIEKQVKLKFTFRHRITFPTNKKNKFDSATLEITVLYTYFS